MTKRSLLAVSVLCCLGCGVALPAELGYARAVTHAVEAGKLAEVNRLCMKWAAAEPGNEQPRLVLGRALLRVDMADRAVDQFELAVEANPLSPLRWCEIATVYLTAHRADDARMEFEAKARRVATGALGEKAMSLKPGDVVECLLDLNGALVDADGMAKLTAVTSDGERAILLGPR